MSIWTDMGFDGIWVDPVSPVSPSAAAKELKNKQRIVIAVDAAYPGVRGSKYPGIEVMLWLRLREKCTGPILLVGFQSGEEILQAHPEHLALLGPMNRYERLPVSAETKVNIKEWLARPIALNDQTIAEKYKPFLASAFDIARFRHRMANIYGLKVIWDAMRIAQGSLSRTPYPVELELAFENSLELHLADVLSFSDSTQMPAKLMNHRLQHAKVIRSAAESAEKSNDSQPTEISGEVHPKDNALLKVLYLLDPGTERYHALESKILKLNELLTRRDDVHAPDGNSNFLVDDAQAKALIKEGVATALAKEKDTGAKSTNAFEPLTNIRVVHVDDQAHIGWSRLFKFMLYGTDVVSDAMFTTTKLATFGGKAVDIWIKQTLDIVTQDIDRIKPSCLLLDLRLLPEIDDGLGNKASSMTGAKLLDALREKYAALPIIITTASNKVWSYEAVRELGADGYWVKPGIDVGLSGEERMISYESIRALISRSLNQPYQLARDLSDFIEVLNGSQCAWWETGCWMNTQQRCGDRKGVLQMMNAMLGQLRSYAEQFSGASTNIVSADQQRALAGLAVTGGVALEYVVMEGMSTYDKQNQMNAAMRARMGKNTFQKLMESRKYAAHAEHVQKLDERITLLKLKELLTFLQVQPTHIR